jgi:nucleoside-diphosphate-sugar epimerase
VLKTRITRPSLGVLIRVVADAILIQVSLIGALAVRFYTIIAFQGVGEYTVHQLLQMYQGWYMRTAIPLTALCLMIFSGIGFYTRGPYYQNRYKVLVVIQAVTASFVLYAFIVLFFEIYGGDLAFAKIALALAWLFSIALLAGARVWNQVWQRTAEAPIAVKRDGPPQVLVIGGAGYIGSALVPKLLDAGYRVSVLDMLLFGDSSLAEVRNHERLEVIKGDFRHADKVFLAMRNVEAVVHLGAIVGDPACSIDENVTIDFNLIGTRIIAEIAKSLQVPRFVFASTCSVYGACDEILDERSQVCPVSLYGRTKYASEQVLCSLSDAIFRPTILRFATIYGLSGRTRFDLVVNLLTAKAKIDGEITIHDGDQWRPFVHVDDSAQAILDVLRAPIETVADNVFNVGSNEQNFTIRQVGEMIHQQVICAELIESTTSNDRRNYRVDFWKIRNLVNFRPRWTLEAGIQQVLESIASGRVSDYKDPRYSNAAFLTQEGTKGLARDQWARELIEDLQTQP